jgi:hypothetical protein
MSGISVMQPNKAPSLSAPLAYQDKLKLKLSHYTPWRRLGGEEVKLLPILDLGTRWGGWSATRPGRTLAPGKGTPGTHCTRSWVGPRAGLDTEVWGKILSPLLGIEPWSPGHPDCSQTLYWLSYPAHIPRQDCNKTFKTQKENEAGSTVCLEHGWQHVINRRWRYDISN